MRYIGDLRHYLGRWTGGDWPKRLPPPVALGGRIGLLLAVYWLLYGWLMTTCRLDEGAYGQPSLIAGLLARLVDRPVVPLVALGLGFWRRGHLVRPWSALEGGSRVRAFVVLVAALLAWQFSTYDYNYHLGQSHLADRLLLLALVPLVAWRPVWIFPFLLLCATVLWQFDYPLGWGYSLAMHKPLVRLLTLFAALLLLRGLDGGRGTADWVFLACCLVAANYWLPGLGKVALGWIGHGHLYFMILGAYAHGWMAGLEAQTLVEAAGALSLFDWPMRLATLAVEVGALFFLWRRQTAKLLLAGWTAFQIGVFAAFGYCFWEWIGVNIGLWLCFFARGQDRRWPIFTRSHFLLSLLVIGGATAWFSPARLAWYDTRLAYTYRFEAVDGEGERHQLPPLAFSPFLDVFTFGTFTYLAPTSQLVGAYGATADRPLARALLRATTPEQIWALEKARVWPSFDPARAAVLDRLLQRFAAHLQEDRALWLSRLKPPPVFWTQAHDPAYTGTRPLQTLNVYRLTWLYDGDSYGEIRREKVRALDLGPVAP